MFPAGFLFTIRRYYSVYAVNGMYHAYMLAGCWQDPASGQRLIKEIERK